MCELALRSVCFLSVTLCSRGKEHPELLRSQDKCLWPVFGAAGKSRKLQQQAVSWNIFTACSGLFTQLCTEYYHRLCKFVFTCLILFLSQTAWQIISTIVVWETESFLISKIVHVTAVAQSQNIRKMFFPAHQTGFPKDLGVKIEFAREE